MKAIIKNKHKTMLEEVEVPTPDEINNILIKVELSAICRTDINVSRGIIPSKDRVILGHEFYGEIVYVGSGVHNLLVGDKVTIDPTKFGKDKAHMCGVDIDGAFAEYIKVPADIVYKLPNDLSPELCAYVEPVAASLATFNANLDKSHKGCIYGNNRIADLTLKIMQAKGYENVIIQNPNNRMESSSFDYIIETVATSSDFSKIIEAVKPFGKVILKSRQYKPVELVISSLVKKNITMCAVSYGDFNEAIELLSLGKLNLTNLIGPTYKIEDFENAFLASEETEAKKIYLKV